MVDGRVYGQLIALMVAILGLVGIWAAVKAKAIRFGSPLLAGTVSVVAGLFGVAVALLSLLGGSSADVRIGILIAGSILFGCGAIALAVGRKGE